LKGTFTIFKALIKVWLRSKTGIFFSFLFPLMLLLTFGTVFGGGQAAKYQLYIQNFDLDDNGEPTELSKTLIKALNSTESFDIKNLDVEVNITEYMRAHPSFTSYRFLIIPKGFQQKAMNKTVSARVGVIIGTLLKIEEIYGKYMDEESRQRVKEGREALSAWRNRTLTAEEAEILLLTEEGDTSAPTIKGIVYSVINALNNVLVGAEEIVSVTSKPIVEKLLTAADYYLPGYIAAFIMTNGIIGVTSNVAEYRRNGVVKRLAATPLPKSSWILGNLLQQTALAFLLTLIMLAVGWFVFGIRSLPDVYALLLIFIGAVTFCSIGMFLGGVIRDVEAAYGAGNAIAFPMMFLSGSFWPIEIMPNYLQTVAKLLPLYYFHDGLRKAMMLRIPQHTITSFIILGALAALFTVLAVKVTRWKELD
jgi:ABC-2 type transport system permease protein